MTTHTIKGQACVNCGANQKAITGLNPDSEQPTPGNPIICESCAGLQTVDENGKFCPMNDEQLRVLFHDRELVMSLVKLASLIRARNFARHRRN